jgi:ABC-type multidrug transport system fused ATPase/permease subunit
VLLITFAAGGVATGIRGYLFTLVGERLVRDIRIKLFNQIIRQDVSFFDENSTGELMNRLASDTSQIKNLLSVNMSMALSAIGQFFVSLILLFVTSWRLTLIMLAVVPILVVFAVVYGRYTKQYSESYQDALAKAAGT